MTPQDFCIFVKAMSDYGVARLKMGDVEINRYHEQSVSIAPEANIEAELKAEQVPLDAPAPANDPIAHKVEELASLLSLKDQDLVDRLFPDHTAPPEDE